MKCLKYLVDATVAVVLSLSKITDNVVQAPNQIKLPVPAQKSTYLTVQCKPKLVKRLIKSKSPFLAGIIMNLKHFKLNFFKPNLSEISIGKKSLKVVPLISKRFLEFIDQKLLKYDFEYRNINRYQSIMLKEKQEMSLIFRIDLIDIFRLYDQIRRFVTSHKMKVIESRQTDTIVFIRKTNESAKTQNTISFKFIHQLISNIGLNNSIQPNMLEWLSTVNISMQKQTVLPIVEKSLPPTKLNKYASIQADDEAGHAYEYFNFPLLEATQPFDFIQTQCFEVEQFFYAKNVLLNENSIPSDTECNIFEKTIEISDSDPEMINFSQNKPLSLDSRQESTISIEELHVISTQLLEDVQVEFVKENLDLPILSQPNLDVIQAEPSWDNQVGLEQAVVQPDKFQENQSSNQARSALEIDTLSPKNKKKMDDTIFIDFVPIKHVNPVMEIPSSELPSQSMPKRLKRNDEAELNENLIVSTNIESTGSSRRKPTKRRIFMKLGLSKKQPIRNHLHPGYKHTNL